MPKRGFLRSPNYPQRYPNSHDSTQTIEVAEGKTIRLMWKRFSVEQGGDWVQIMDEDGTDLTPKLSGPLSLPRPIFSNSNIVHVKFHTDFSRQYTGWKLEWTEQ